MTWTPLARRLKPRGTLQVLGRFGSAAKPISFPRPDETTYLIRRLGGVTSKAHRY